MSQPGSGNLLHIYLAVMLKEKLNILHYYSSYLFYSTAPSKIPHVFVLQIKLSWRKAFVSVIIASSRLLSKDA